MSSIVRALVGSFVGFGLVLLSTMMCNVIMVRTSHFHHDFLWALLGASETCILNLVMRWPNNEPKKATWLRLADTVFFSGLLGSCWVYLSLLVLSGSVALGLGVAIGFFMAGAFTANLCVLKSIRMPS